MSKQEKYTLEDWKSGKTIIGENGNSYQNLEIARLKTIAGFDDVIDEVEYSKINHCRSKIVDMAVELVVDAKKKRLHINIDKVIKSGNDPCVFIEEEIVDAERFINENRLLLKKYLKGDREPGKVTARQYREITKLYDNISGKSMSYVWIEVDKGKPRLQEMYVLKHYLEYLHEVKKKHKKDGRGIGNIELKPNTIIPEPKFFEIIDSWSNPKTDKGLNSNLVEVLMEEHEVKGDVRFLVGYKIQDKKKNHQVRLSKSTIERRARQYLDPENKLHHYLNSL